MLRCSFHLLHFLTFFEELYAPFASEFRYDVVDSFQRTAADVGVFSVIMMF